MWHASFRSGVATLRTDIHLLLTYLLTYLNPVLCIGMVTACYRLEFGVVVGRRQSHEDYTVLFRRGMQMRV